MVKILIIEDDALMSRLYEKAFKFEGYEVEVADNGQGGLEKARQNNPTIIILDIMMPEMDGLKVLDKLKADSDTKTIPVIVLTNLSTTEDAEAALTKGAVKYIVKSEHDPKHVADMIKEVLAGYTRDEIPQAASES